MRVEGAGVANSFIERFVCVMFSFLVAGCLIRSLSWQNAWMRPKKRKKDIVKVCKARKMFEGNESK